MKRLLGKRSCWSRIPALAIWTWVALGAACDSGAGEDPAITEPPPAPPALRVVSGCDEPGVGQTWDVGPDQACLALADVPWQELGPGDTVRVHHRVEPYREKILISGRGTKDAPIRVCGVPASDGALPVIDGADATTPSALDFGDDPVMEQLAVVLIDNYDWDALKPAHILIEGLELRGAHPDNELRRVNGTWTRYLPGAAGLRIQRGEQITIRGCQITDNTNGIFTMCQGESGGTHVTRDLVIERNTVWGNGIVGSDQEHNLYVQAIGVVYQNNVFGQVRPGAEGAVLKDRSTGSVVRYNRFANAPRTLDLVEAEDYCDLLRDDPALMAAYRETFVYGNVFDLRGSVSGNHHIHYGWDNEDVCGRGGTLWFFHNTVRIRSDQDTEWRQVIFDVASNEETVQAVNNVFIFESETPGATPSRFAFGDEAGHVRLGRNLILGEWHAAIEGNEGVVDLTLTDTLIEMPAGADAGLDEETLAPLAGSPVVDEAASVPPSVPAAHGVTSQMTLGADVSTVRPVCGSASDLGAFEWCPEG